MTLAISYFALTDRFRASVETGLGGPVRFDDIGRLRNSGMAFLLREIRKLRADHIAVAIETDDARSLWAPLLAVALLTGSRRISTVWPDGSVSSVSKWRAAATVLQIGAVQIRSRLAYRRGRRALARLAHTPGSAVRGDGNHRVLYLDANLSFGLKAGGSVGHIKGVLDGLVEAGFEVDLASAKAPPTRNSKVVWRRIEPDSLFAYPSELNHYLFAERFEAELSRNLAGQRYGFLYQRMSLHNASGAKLSRRFGIPFVLEYNGSEAWTYANWLKKLPMHDAAVATESAVLKSADLVVTVSDALGDELRRAGVPDERIVVYPNCVDPAVFDPARFTDDMREELRRSLGISTGAKVATFVGTFGKWHGVDFLARAIRRLVDEDQEWISRHDLHFLIVGDGLKMPDVRKIMAGERYERRVTLTGLVAQQETPLYLAASDLFLSPHIPNEDGSAFFGSPTKLFEYMAMEKPIIASDLDQIGVVLRDGQGRRLGELYKPGDEEAFLAGLRAIVEHPVQAAETASRARAMLLERYTWRHHVEAILARMRALNLV